MGEYVWLQLFSVVYGCRFSLFQVSFILCWLLLDASLLWKSIRLNFLYVKAAFVKVTNLKYSLVCIIIISFFLILGGNLFFPTIMILPLWQILTSQVICSLSFSMNSSYHVLLGLVVLNLFSGFAKTLRILSVPIPRDCWTLHWIIPLTGRQIGCFSIPL